MFVLLLTIGYVLSYCFTSCVCLSYCWTFWFFCRYCLAFWVKASSFRSQNSSA